MGKREFENLALHSNKNRIPPTTHMTNCFSVNLRDNKVPVLFTLVASIFHSGQHRLQSLVVRLEPAVRVPETVHSHPVSTAALVRFHVDGLCGHGGAVVNGNGLLQLEQGNVIAVDAALIGRMNVLLANFGHSEVVLVLIEDAPAAAALAELATRSVDHRVNASLGAVGRRDDGVIGDDGAGALHRAAANQLHDKGGVGDVGCLAVHYSSLSNCRRERR